MVRGWLVEREARDCVSEPSFFRVEVLRMSTAGQCAGRKRSGAGVAQLVEHFTRNEGVSGSIPLTSSK